MGTGIYQAYKGWVAASNKKCRKISPGSVKKSALFEPGISDAVF